MYYGRTSRRAAQVARSQLAVRLGLAVYAAVCTAAILRCVVLMLSFPETVWSVDIILSASAPISFPFTLIGPANRTVIGSATLADLTALLLLVTVPLPFLGRRAPTPGPGFR